MGEKIHFYDLVPDLYPSSHIFFFHNELYCVANDKTKSNFLAENESNNG